MKLFSELIKTINDFLPEEPIKNEIDMEERLTLYLLNNGYNVSRQITKKCDRYDIICRRMNEQVCLELKLRTDISDIKQFDRYLSKFKDGLIVVCWQASFSISDIFTEVAEQSPIPIALIELSKEYSLA